VVGIQRHRRTVAEQPDFHPLVDLTSPVTFRRSSIGILYYSV
jgi:hypothetical protein